MTYQSPPKPGTYYITSVAAPKNVIEVYSRNPERAICSPKAEKPAPYQQWYIQRSGRGYKIKNVMHGVYLALHSPQHPFASVIGTSSSHGSVDWSFMRTHDGFSIQYGEEDLTINLHRGLDVWGNPLHLWGIGPQDPSNRWKLEHISDDVGGEVAETVEDRIAVLSDQLRKKDIELAAWETKMSEKDQLLARKERELQDALQNRCEVSPRAIGAHLSELRTKIQGLENLVMSDNAESPIYLHDIVPQYDCRRWKLERIGFVTSFSLLIVLLTREFSDSVGGEVAETVEDRIVVLSEQLQKRDIEIAKKDAEIAVKDKLLARKEQKEQELRDTLERLRCSGTLPKLIQAQLAELREKIEGLECLVESYNNHFGMPNNTS
ncbi:unnamed protein product [Rhizoctonia solani]|uniref:Ricin B lectin domain-containing protein n=1 Tax=Rhizoctonia solani TaxID=456999 RepID=A0A8H3DU80_9AGAM|nr:unnamed protein product [Rhizoctonia solani]